MGSPAIADMRMTCAGSTAIKGSATILVSEAATKTNPMARTEHLVIERQCHFRHWHFSDLTASAYVRFARQNRTFHNPSFRELMHLRKIGFAGPRLAEQYPDLEKSAAFQSRRFAVRTTTSYSAAGIVATCPSAFE
jgi:hypothetical protein